jgi:AcrR family transcriptional regulator
MSKPSPSERLESVAAAAIEAFGRVGYRGARTADIAARAGLSAGSLFTYVESKEALFHLVFLYALGLLPEAPELPLPTPAPGETVALFAQALQGVPVSRIRAALMVRESDDAGQELREIVEELYDTMEQYWPLLAVVERCSREIPDLNALWFGESRIGIYSDLAEYLQRRAASGQLRQMPDSTMAARLIGELVAWFAWHRREDHDAALYDDKDARRTVIEFACAALVPDSAQQGARESSHHAEGSTRHEGSH